MKVKNSLKAQTNKTTYMSDQAFALRKALKDALAFERVKCRDLHVSLIKRSKQPLTCLTKLF
jgi:hypothetical protein